MNRRGAPGVASGLRLFACAVLSLALMIADHHGSYAEWLRSALSVAVYPIRFAVSELFVVFPETFAQWFTSRHELISENDALRRQVLLLGSRIMRQQEIEDENRRLRELLESSAEVEDRVLVARVLDLTIDPASSRATLDKGRQHGIRPGQSVIDAEGIIGQVDHVGPVSSAVILITDPSHALPVSHAVTGFLTVAVGRGLNGELDLSHVPKDVDIGVGDLLVSSGLGGRFPVGYPAGRVLRVDRSTGRSYARVRVRPIADLKRAREVLVIQRPPEVQEHAGAP